MKKYKLKILAVLGMFAWFAMGINFVLAQEVIFPVNTNMEPIKNSSVTITILDQNDNDITGYWLPEPGFNVKIKVNGADSPINFVILDPKISDPIQDRRLTTSAYPGICTNFGNETESDFEFNETTNILTPKDFGGMAVMVVNGLTFIIPADADFDGIPDNYEKKYCTEHPEMSLTCLNSGDDFDPSPEKDLSPKGDGIAARDEYRGFMVSGKHIRTDPRVKDFFVHLVNEPQCETTALLFNEGTQINLNTFFGDDLNTLFSNMSSFYTGIQVHLIDSVEWIDNFESYDRLSGIHYLPNGPVTDRRITPNALVSTPENSNPPKGVRLIECLDLLENSPLGLALKKAPADGLEKNDGNAVIYTQRIWKNHKYSFDLSTLPLQYYSFVNGAWILKETFAPPPKSGAPLEDYLANVGVNRIIKELFAFYAVHEGIGHPLDLTPTVESTRKESYGYHHADGTGTSIDVKILQVIDKKYNKFYIPISFGISDKRDMRILSSQIRN